MFGTDIDQYGRPITSTAAQVMAQAREPARMLGGPGMAEQDVGEVGPQASPQPPRGQVGKPAALPMPGPPQQPSARPQPVPGPQGGPPSPGFAEGIQRTLAGQQPAPNPAQPVAPPIAPPVEAPEEKADPRDTLRQVGAMLLGAHSPAMRVQGLQMMFEAQQPLPGEVEDAKLARTRKAEEEERTRLRGAIDTEAGGADDEVKQRAKLGVALGAKPNEILKVLGFDEKKGMRGQQAIDRAFAPDYVKFKTGGAAQSQKNMDQLRDARKALVENEHDFGVTGKIGYVPDSLAALFPAGERAISVREAVEEVVSRSLRETLGAQFTQEEGKRLIARAYNPKLKPEENAARLDRLLSSMEVAMQDKLDAVKYFDENDTLKGFTGRLNPTITDFEKVLDKPKEETAIPPRPQGMDDATLLQRAQKAIQGGANPEVIKARLKAWGLQ